MGYKLHKTKKILSAGEETFVNTNIELDNNLVIKAPNEIKYLIELPDRIIILLNWYHATNLYEISQNLFCYSKQTGKLLWQVAEYNHKGYKVKSVYVGMAIEIKENGKVVKRYAIMVDKHEIEIDKPNLDLSKCEFSAGLQNGFEYLIDINTGEILDCIGWTK